MGVDRNNIPDSYFCELCQPRVLDAVKAKAMQKRKREELAGTFFLYEGLERFDIVCLVEAA